MILLQCLMRWVAAATVLGSGAALAQQQQQQQQGESWERMGHMQLEGQFAGPMKDTAIQRWRDPQSGVLCYLYVPFMAQHSPPTATGYVQYGANTIGTISCVPPAAVERAPPARATVSKPSPAPKRAPE